MYRNFAPRVPKFTCLALRLSLTIANCFIAYFGKDLSLPSQRATALNE